MYTTILVIHIIVAISMIGLILIQHGKGADAGASFGGDGSATVFGASGSANFLTRLTAVLTAVFFVTSMTLAIFSSMVNLVTSVVTFELSVLADEAGNTDIF